LTVLTLSAYLTIALTRTLPGGMYPVDSSNEVVKQQQEECLVRMTASAQTEGQTTTPATMLAAAQEDCSQAQALSITFPPELLLALGISAASFAGSTLVQSTKKSKTVSLKAVGGDLEPIKKKCDDATTLVQAKKSVLDIKLNNVNAKVAAVEEAKKKLDEAKAANANIPEAESALAGVQAALKLDQDDARKAVQDWEAAKQALAAAQQELATAQTQAENRLAASEGLLHKNSDPAQARWSDLFRAEEIGVNFKLLDISKVQMFFFTVALISAYAFALAALLQDANAIHNPFWVDLPPFSTTMNVLLAISHGTYLSVKTVDRTPSTSE